MKREIYISAALAACLACGSSCVLSLSDEGEGAKPDATATETTAAQEKEKTPKPVKEQAETPLPEIPLPAPQAAALAKNPQRLSPDAQRLEWLSDCSLAALDKTTPKDRLWSEEAGNFVKDAVAAEAGRPGAPSLANLESRAILLTEKGCDDPIARLWAGLVLRKAGKNAAALPSLRKAASRLQWLRISETRAGAGLRRLGGGLPKRPRR